MNSSTFIFIWFVSVLVFVAGQLAAPDNYDQGIGVWGGFFGVTFLVGVASFVLAIVFWIMEKRGKNNTIKSSKPNHMKCKNCQFINSSDSVYCQECGDLLMSSGGTESRENDSKSISDELSEVIFVPKNKSNHFTVIMVLILFGLIVIVGLFLFSDSESYQQTSIDTADSVTPNSEVISQFPINLLSLQDIETNFEGDQFYFSGLIKNNSDEHAVDVVIRLDFTWDQAGNNKFDSRFVFVDYVAANGVRTLREPVDVYVPPNRDFWTQYVIESAE